MASAIVAEVVKYLETLPLTQQTEVLNYVIRLRGTTPNSMHQEDDGIPSVSEVVARIQAMSPNLEMVTPPQGSLVDALRDGPTDPTFDLQRWEQEWSIAEDELRRINLEDDISEGRI